MRIDTEFFILGNPIETEIGNAQFIKVKDYPDIYSDLNILSASKFHFLHNFLSSNQANNEQKEWIERASLYEIVSSVPDISYSYYRVFAKVFDVDNAIERVNSENFNYYRALIMKMNCMKEEKINPNPEIQRAIERSKRVKAQEGGKLTFTDIVTSIVGYNGLTYESINDFTIYQLYQTFHRIGQIKNYDTSTLFATVSSEKINIESWNKHIDLYEEESHFVSEQQFKKNTGSVFNDQK